MINLDFDLTDEIDWDEKLKLDENGTMKSAMVERVMTSQSHDFAVDVDKHLI